MSIPADPSISIIKQKLQQDTATKQAFHEYTTHQYIAVILPKKQNFSSRVSIVNRSMEQPWVPISPTAANLFMEESEAKSH